MLSFRPGAWLVFLLPQVAILSQTTCFAADDLETIRSRRDRHRCSQLLM